MILCTMPGRSGDILWSLPTVRAISETIGEPVDLLISGKYGSLQPLLQQQPYLRVAAVMPDWQVQETAPMTPREPPARPLGSYDQVIHLGYAGWPAPDLARDSYQRAQGVIPGLRALELERPWITAAGTGLAHRVTIGFTDEWFELKFGLASLLAPDCNFPSALCLKGSRWATADDRTQNDFFSVWPCAWVEAAQTLAQTQVFLGCCSALHVLAVGLGIPCVIVEPAPARHHDTFYPLGKTGRVRLVLGGDGLPTVDARHVAEVVQDRLAQAPAKG